MFLIYLPKPTPRSLYVLDWIFRQQWGVAYSICSHSTRHTDDIIINYSHDKVHSLLHVLPAGLLEDDSLKTWNPKVQHGESFPVLFPDESEMGFDIFSAVFYLLSRYEEYLPFTPDEHGRFPAEASLAYQHGFLNIPVVDRWLARLKSVLSKKVPGLSFRANTFSGIITYDIDATFQYRGKGIVRSVAGMVRDAARLAFKAVFRRGRALFSIEADPWNVFSHLRNVLENEQLSSVFFYLVGDSTPRDPNLPYQHPYVRNVVAYTAEFSDTGLHPSYHSSCRPELLRMEKARLENILEQKVLRSRQHFLRFSLPDTWHHLMHAGITEDYSLLYPEAPGFRAGTARPFYFYDLKNECTTLLKIFPGTCMDYTFYKYLKMDADDAFREMQSLLKEVKKSGGIFIPVFHNEILGFSEWRNIHDQLLEELSLPPYNETDN